MHWKATTVCLAVAATAHVLTSCASSGNPEDVAPAARVNPAQIQELAKSPAPGADATMATVIGSGKTMIETDADSDDQDATWGLELDLDGDGNPENVRLLWDDELGMLFAHAETDVVCAYGGVTVAEVLIGVNAKGNPRGKPAGSGFYAVFLEKNECNSEGTGLYGARFSPSGHITEAGAVVLVQEDDEINVMIVEPGYYVY